MVSLKSSSLNISQKDIDEHSLFFDNITDMIPGPVYYSNGIPTDSKDKSEKIAQDKVVSVLDVQKLILKNMNRKKGKPSEQFLSQKKQRVLKNSMKKINSETFEHKQNPHMGAPHMGDHSSNNIIEKEIPNHTEPMVNTERKPVDQILKEKLSNKLQQFSKERNNSKKFDKRMKKPNKIDNDRIEKRMKKSNKIDTNRLKKENDTKNIINEDNPDKIDENESKIEMKKSKNANDDNIKFSNLFFEDQEIKLKKQIDGIQNPPKPGTKKKRLEKDLKKLTKEKKIINNVKDDNKEEVEKMLLSTAYQYALNKISGIKVKDNPDRIKKSLKNQQKKKEKHTKEWKKRQQIFNQQKRKNLDNENISKRKKKK